MFFIQTQLSENACGYWTDVPAYFYLNERLFPAGLISAF